MKWVWVVGVCLGLSVGGGSVAASTDAALRVHLTGPGVEVSVSVAAVDGSSSPHDARLGGDARMAAVDALVPGDYDIRVTLSGGRTSSQRITLRPAHAAVFVVTTTGDGGVPALARVDDIPSGEGARFDTRALRDLPTADNLWSLVETAAPFVITDRQATGRLDTGGLGTGTSALAGSRGESWALTQVSFDGLPVRLPTRTGQLAALPDMNAAVAVSVDSGVAPIEIDTPGVVVHWTPRRPGTSWRGGMDVSATTPGMVGENGLSYAPSLGRIQDWRNAGVFAGGPITDRTGLFISSAFTRATFLEREIAPLLTSETQSLLGHLVMRPSSGEQVRILAAWEGAEVPFDERRQFADPTVTERTAFARGQASWDSSGRRGGQSRIAFGFQRGAWRPDVAAGLPGGTMDRVLHGVVPSPAADTTLTQLDMRAEWMTPVMRLGGLSGHGRVGMTVRRSSIGREMLAAPIVGESVAGLPARVWIPAGAGSPSERTVREVGLYAADQFMLGPRFTLDAGLRLDLVRGSNGGATSLNWTTFSPRVSFRWSPAAMSFFGGVGRYAGGQPLSFLGFGDPGETTWDVYRWTDPNADGRFNAGEGGVLVARAGSGVGVGSIDPDLRVPRTTEWVAGAEVRPTQYSVLRGSIIIRRQTDLVGVVNTGLSASDYRRFVVPDINADEGSPLDDQLLPIFERLPASFGRDALLLTNPDADPIAHDGIEVTYEISSPRWFMLFGGTAYRTLGRGGTLGHGVLENDQLVLGDRYSNPNALKDVAGRLFFDRAYVGKWTTAYRAPGDVRLAAVVRYQDGQPFTRYVVAPDLAGGPEITHAYPMGRTRFTYTATVDFRIEKGVSWGDGRRASVRLDVFNLTNHTNELEEDVLSGPTFRLSSIVQPPITFRLGMRVDF